MLAQNADTGVLAPVGNTNTEIIKWVSDGIQYFIGFMGTGSYSGTFKLFVKLPTDSSPVCYYSYQTSPSNRTAYVVDRVVKFPVGTEVSLQVVHDSSAQEKFTGTILGGAN